MKYVIIAILVILLVGCSQLQKTDRSVIPPQNVSTAEKTQPLNVTQNTSDVEADYSGQAAFRIIFDAQPSETLKAFDLTVTQVRLTSVSGEDIKAFQGYSTIISNSDSTVTAAGFMGDADQYTRARVYLQPKRLYFTQGNSLPFSAKSAILDVQLDYDAPTGKTADLVISFDPDEIFYQEEESWYMDTKNMTVSSKITDGLLLS